ncbi:unnamed protein product, partial [Mesorhabditis belari]|uniref:Transthyretin-like family protein n=1 Tax=Mesorhabditis belari TaxID=2138241 RepID=A0AAF3FJY5_9BILA
MILRLFFLLIILSITLAFRQQSVGIIGKLTCGNQVLQDTEIKLWDKNSLVLKMDVHFKVYHNCENPFGLCKRKVDLEVPASYVTRSSTVEKWFDAGVLNMAFKYPDESTECL